MSAIGALWRLVWGTLLLGAAARPVPGNRDSAFIGYHEVVNAGCQDLLDNCEDKAGTNTCLSDPYLMRSLCPISCNVERCTSAGTKLVSQQLLSCRAPPPGAQMHILLMPLPRLCRQCCSLCIENFRA